MSNKITQFPKAQSFVNTPFYDFSMILYDLISAFYEFKMEMLNKILRYIFW